jgi:hypothetical protein
VTERAPVPEIEQFTALVAVEIARSRDPIIAGVRGRTMAAGVPGRLGLSQPGMQLLPFLRNMLPDRSVSLDALRACELYIPDPTYNSALAELVSASLVDISDSTVVLTDGGREVARETHDLLAAEVNELWGRDPNFADLERITRMLVDAAAGTGGLAFSVMAPPFEPPGSTSGSRCAENLNCLRVHRGDAHIEAWTSAGFTVEQIQALDPGPERDAVEQETNRLASKPYATLDSDERSLLLEAVRALPG